MIGKKALFYTKFACDSKYNGKECKIIAINKYRTETRYLVEFEDKYRVEVYDNELVNIEK